MQVKAKDWINDTIKQDEIDKYLENGNDFILNGGEFSCSITLHFQQTISAREIRKEILLENKIMEQMKINEIKEETE